MAEMTDFEKTLLEKVDKLNESLSILTERLTTFEGRTEKALSELSGKIKGNHELIKTEIQTYVEKDTCETHRGKQGERIGKIETDVALLKNAVSTLQDHEDKHEIQASERITAWLPSIISVIAIIGAIIVLFSMGVF